MKIKIKENLILKIISVIIAIILWASVQTTVKPQIEWKIKAQVEFTNKDPFENRNLYIVNEEDHTVTVKAKGTLLELLKRKNSDCKVKCDLSDINNRGEYQDLKYTCTSESGKVTYTIIGNSGELIVKEIITKEIPVKFALEGEAQDGKYVETENIKVTAEKVSVEGLDDDIKKIDYAKIVLNRKNVAEDETIALKAVYCDSNDKPINTQSFAKFESSQAEIEVSVNVLETKKVKLYIDGISENDKYKIKPSDEVVIVGEKEELEKIEKIDVKKPVLSSEEKGYTQEIEIRYPKNIKPLKEIKYEVEIVKEDD